MELTSQMNAEGADPAAKRPTLPIIEIKAQKAFRRLDVITNTGCKFTSSPRQLAPSPAPRHHLLQLASLSVFGAIDTAALPILLAVDLTAFPCAQFAAVDAPVRSHFLIDARLITFETCCLARV